MICAWSRSTCSGSLRRSYANVRWIHLFRDMDCRITSTNKVRQSGMTLVELLLATSVGSVVSLGVALLMIYSGRTFAAMANYVSLDRASRNALDTMSKQIRQTNKLTEFTPTSLTFQ